MKISKTNFSRLKTTDFNNLKFGTVFSDHMFICKYTNGKWGKIKIKPYGPLKMSPGSQILHYGQAVFEGMKAFKNDNNEVLLFRKNENFKRLNQSARRLSIPEIPEDIFMRGLNELVSIDSDWCKKDDGYSLYIRPFIYASSECIKASSSNEFTFVIITSPTTKYYAGDMHVVIEEHYSRAPKGGVGFTKAAGNYAASFFPTKQANSNGFQQVIWTDAVDHQYIEESGTMNIWFRIGDKLITPSLSDSILGGITRKSLIALSKDNGIDVEERKIKVSEILDANQRGLLKEAFGSGTAVTVNPINSITYNNIRMNLDEQQDSYSLKLKSLLQGIQKGRIYDKYNWTEKVN